MTLQRVEGGPLVRALRARAGMLLLITQRILYRGSKGSLASFWYKLNVLKIDFYPFFISHVLAIRVIIYFINTIDS